MPYLTIDYQKIVRNTRAVVDSCAHYGIDITGVAKVSCGNARLASAMLRGDVQAIGDSRLGNIDRMRAKGIEAAFMLLRSPTLSQVDAVVRTAAVSLNSEISIVKALGASALKRGRIHDIILMIDLGDLREGLWADELIPVVRAVKGIPGVRLVGLGTNLGCYGGVVPTVTNMSLLADCAQAVETVIGRSLRYVSGGNSSSLPLVRSGVMPSKINHLRVGESILLGRDIVDARPIPGCSQDAFKLFAEVIEVKRKPSVPVGRISRDAFGQRPVFADLGPMQRAILDLGRADIDIDGLVPECRQIKILGASSDHLIVDVTRAPRLIRPGDTLAFNLNYAGLLRCMLSHDVEKKSCHAE